MNGIKAVIVLAAGQGTRMKSDLPKVLHPLAGLSLIGYALKTAAALEPGFIVPVVRHQRGLVVSEIHRLSPAALIADQDDIPGTGRAVQCALDALKEAGADLEGTVVVTSADVPLLEKDTLEQLVLAHAGQLATVLTTRVDDPFGYGRIVTDDSGHVQAIVEEKDATEQQRCIRQINAGIYAFDGTFLKQALASVGQSNAQGEVYLTDVIAQAAALGRAGAFELEDVWQAQGCNDRAQLAELALEKNRRICHNLMVSGVTIVDPAQTRIDVGVKVGRDTTIYPGTYLQGATRIGTHCQIGPGTTLKSVVVGDHSVVPHTWGAGTMIPADSRLLPFSIVGEERATA